jgi:arabinofuranan 3-O-arabinosyltransferase
VTARDTQRGSPQIPSLLTRIGVAARDWPPIPGAAWAYLGPSLAAAVAVQFWFRAGSGLAGGDLPPPVTPGRGYLAHWNQFGAGTGATEYSIISLPYFEGLRLFEGAGLDAVSFQRLWLSILLAGSAASVVFLARQLFRSSLAAAVAGIVATFNVYHLTTGFDAVPLVATLAAAVLGGLVIRAGREEHPVDPILFAIGSLTLSVVFVNTPHLALVVAWVAISVLLGWAAFGRRAVGRMGRFLLIAVPLSLLFNLWWIVPAALTVTGPVFSESFAAAGVSEWAWTHARNSIPNVLSLTSVWGWSHPEYYPFSARLQELPFNVLQYTLAAAAGIGLVTATSSRLRVAWLLASVGVASIWLLKGLHAPFSASNLWLYDHVPGLWLFRDPAKIRLVLVLVLALLAGIAVLETQRLSRPAAIAVAVAIVGGTAASAYPLLTGAVVADKRPLLPSAHVVVPASWYRAASYLDSSPRQGKVVVLPRLDYYQAPTTWGYYGTSFLHQLIRRPVVEPLPGGYFAPRSVTALVDSLQENILLRGDVTDVLQTLGARYVLLRRDLDLTFPGRSFVAPSRLARALRGVPELRHVRSFGFVDLYEARGVSNPEVYPATPIVHDAAANTSSLFRTLRLGAMTALVSSTSDGALSEVARGTVRLTPRFQGVAALTAEQTGRNTIVRIDRRPSQPHHRTVLRFPSVPYPLQLIVGGERPIVRRADRTTVLSTLTSSPPLYRFPRTAPADAIPFRSSAVRNVGDCNHYDDRNANEVGLQAELVKRGDAPTIRLAARDHAACIAMPIVSQPQVPFLLRLEYRTVAGAPARVCVWEEKPQRCATLPPLDAEPGWHELKAVVRAARGTRNLYLFLYADGGGDTMTITEYRRLSIKLGRAHDAVAVAPAVSLPRVSYRRVAPYEFKAHVTNARRPFLLVAAETYAPGWRIEASGRSSEGVAHIRVNGYANGWRIPWKGTYDVTIEYAPERYAQLARRADLVLIPLSLLGWLAWRLRPVRHSPR